MNDLDFGGDLRAALHRDADLVGSPSSDLLDQLGRRRQHQRRQRAALLGVAAAVVIVAGGIPVGMSLAASPAPAAPATQPIAPTPSPTPTVLPTPAPITPGQDEAEASSASAALQSAQAAASSAQAASSATLVLGPDGLGSLKLGMSRAQAEATGAVEPFRNEPNSEMCRWQSRLSGAPAGKGIVLYSETLGVATIDAYEGVRTPEGITIGSSLAELHQAYSGWEEDPHLRRNLISVPGHSQLVYRVAYANGRVTQLTLQYRDQNCYE